MRSNKINKKGLKIFMGAVIFSSVIVVSGIALDSHVDHSEKICPITKIENYIGFDGNNHQVKAMDRDYTKKGYQSVKTTYKNNYFPKYILDYDKSKTEGKNIFTGEYEEIDWENISFTVMPILEIQGSEMPVKTDLIIKIEDDKVLFRDEESNKEHYGTKTSKVLVLADEPQEVFVTTYKDNGITKVKKLEKK